MKFYIKINIEKLAIILALPLFFSACEHNQNIALFSLDSLLLNSFSQPFHFTRPDLSMDDPLRRQPVEQTVAFIQDSRRSIEGWVYEFNQPDIIQALMEARKRGVTVSLSGSKDQNYEELKEAGFYIPLRTRSGIAHAKVLLIDRKYLISGTGNFTISDMGFSNNAFFFLVLNQEAGAAIAETLSREERNLPPISLPFQGKAFLSPLHGRLIQSILVEAILQARHSIRYMIFSHSDPFITSALRLAAARGVSVEGIYDNPSGKTVPGPQSQEGQLYLSSYHSGLWIYLEGNRVRYRDENGIFHGGHLHHKTVIIDDSVVYTGSYNWSYSARDSNLEIFYIFHDPLTSAAFLDEFRRIRDRASLLPPPTVPIATDPRMKMEESRLCNRTGARREILYFAGQASTLRGGHFKISNDECEALPSGAIHDFGIQAGSSYPLPLFHTAGEFRHTEDLSRFANPPLRDVELCDANCIPETVENLDTDAGWIWLATEAQYSSFQIWDFSGLSPLLQFTEMTGSRPGSRLYSFPPYSSSSHALLFFHGEAGERGIGCKGGAANMPTALFAYLDRLRFDFKIDSPCR